MIKLLIGGSPCTYWSIAQKKGRETTAEGLGWELFKNYLIAKEKFKPDFFLYENNKSAAQDIKDQIKRELNVWSGSFVDEDSGARYIEINSALVSAQNRRRFYCHNCGDVGQPEDRGILLKDVLDSGMVDMDKAYCLKHQSGNARDHFKKHHTNIAFEHKVLTDREMNYMVGGSGKWVNDRWGFMMKPGESDKAGCVTANIHKGVPYNVVAEPVNITDDGKSQTLKAQYGKNSVSNFCCYTSTYGATGVAEPVRVGVMPRIDGVQTDSKQYRVYDPCGKSTTLCGQGGGLGAKTGLYAVQEKSGKTYTVKDGMITVNGKEYPIRLKDGEYCIRKLSVAECCRLQTLPDDYCRAVSETQAYKGLGNGWTAEVIMHILRGALNNVDRNEEIVVLSMYDGIGTGRYCLDKLGFKNVRYYAYEIDKYAMTIAKSNYPDIIEMGDAYQVRKDEWSIENDI